MNIGVAKPTAAELQAVPHFFINSHSIDEEVNAGLFEQYALDAAAQIFKQNDVAVMVGGTGLYIKAFCEGMDDMPTINPLVRQQVMDDYEAYGLQYLQQQVADQDPAFWKIAEQQNPQRLMRALEIIRSTGQSSTVFRKGEKKKRPFKIIKVGLELPRDQLYQQINQRVDLMIENGLTEEVKQLIPKRENNALQTVGYRELFEYFVGAITLEQAINNIKTNTRHYAKRQLTWYKKDAEIQWYHAHQFSIDGFVQTLH